MLHRSREPPPVLPEIMKRVVSEVPRATWLIPKGRRGTSDTIYWTKPRASLRLWGFNRGPSPWYGACRKEIAPFGRRRAGQGHTRDARLGSLAADPRGSGRATRFGGRGIPGHP